MLETVGILYVLAKKANQLRVQAAACKQSEKGARINSMNPRVTSTAMGRIGTPGDIDSAVEFLVRASFVTGVDFSVGGGAVAARKWAST